MHFISGIMKLCRYEVIVMYSTVFSGISWFIQQQAGSESYLALAPADVRKLLFIVETQLNYLNCISTVQIQRINVYIKEMCLGLSKMLYGEICFTALYN
jgi:hypothetical protein